MSGEPTEEESKNNNVVRIQMKPYDADDKKATSFFTDLNAEQVLTELVSYLEIDNTKFNISGNASKISFTKVREDQTEETKEGETAIRE